MPPPTYRNKHLDIRCGAHARSLITAVLQGRRPLIVGRDIRKSVVRAGNIFVVQPRSSPTAIKSYRHTDDKTWMPGRMYGPFVLYQECEARPLSPMQKETRRHHSHAQHCAGELSYPRGSSQEITKKQLGRRSLAQRDSTSTKIPRVGGLRKYTLSVRVDPRYPKHVVRLVYYTSDAHEARHRARLSTQTIPPSPAAMQPVSIPPSSTPAISSTPALLSTYPFPQLPTFSTFLEYRTADSMEMRKMALLRSEGVLRRSSHHPDTVLGRAASGEL